MNILKNNSIQNLHSFYNLLSNSKDVRVLKKERYSIIHSDKSAWPNSIYSDDVDYLNNDDVLNEIVNDIKDQSLLPLLYNYEEICDFEKLKTKGIYLIDKWILMDFNLDSYSFDNEFKMFGKIETKKELLNWVDVLSKNLFDSKKLNYEIFFYLMNNGCEILDLRIENEIVGTSLVYYDSNKTAGIYMVSVNQEKRGSGYGKKLMDYTFNCINKKGFNKITLQSTKSGYPLYKSLNFKNTGNINLLYKLIK